MILIKRYLLWGLCLCFLAASAQSRVVETRLASGNGVLAEYAEGDEGAVPVLILHGFLQTHNFSTVKRLHDALAESGFAVLSPTLSLGIHKRKQSLDCAALHLHDLAGDAAELAHWVEWLHQRHGQPVVVISHSSGGQVMTRYLHEHKDAPVARGILISLSPLPGAEGEPVEGPIGNYSLGFCEEYATTPQAFDSYVDWGGEAMQSTLQSGSHPVSLILGTEDGRISAQWRLALDKSGIAVIDIEGANHFFDNAHEFDLLDAVEGILDGI